MSFKTDLPNIFPDFVTCRNFLYFLLCREYIEYTSNIKFSYDFIDEETKCNFYIFLFKANKDESIDLFKYIKENDSAFKNKLNNLVIKRIEILLSNLNELIAYNDILDLVNSVMSTFHEKSDVIGNDGKGKICKYSLIGIFLRKFCLSFQSLSIEKVLSFMRSFREVCENCHIITKMEKKIVSEVGELMKIRSLTMKQDRLSKDQVLWELEKIYNELEKVLYAPNVKVHENNITISKLRQKLQKYKAMYPDIYESFFLDSLLTIHNRDFEVIEKDILMKYPTKFLGFDCETDAGLLHDSSKDTNKDNLKKLMLKRKIELHQKLSEVSLNCVVTFSSMDFKNEALLYYKDGILNAKLSKQKDLVAEVGSVGNSLMPINDNPNGTLYSVIDVALNDKTALGSIRDFLLQSLHNNRSTLAELLHHFFCSSAPQRRELTPICLIYLSIIFRYFGFHIIANTYLMIAGHLEAIKPTKSHQEILVEVFSQFISSYSNLGRFDKAFNLYKNLKIFGNGMLCSNRQLKSSMLQSSFSHSLMRSDFSKSYKCLENLRRISLAEYGLRKVQMLFMESNDDSPIALGNHIISFAVKKREILIYNHVSISKGCATISSMVNQHKSCGIVHNMSEIANFKDLPSLDDANSQNWGSRDWAIYECRCRWLMCTQLINRHDIKNAKIHLNCLQELASKFFFYQFLRLCQVIELAITNVERESQRLPLISPLLADSDLHEFQNILLCKLGLSCRDHMLFVNLLVNLYVSQSNTTRSLYVEKLLTELLEYCEKCCDRMGQARCWNLIYCYNNAIGNDEAKSRALNELELLLENKLTTGPNLDFLSYVM